MIKSELQKVFETQTGYLEVERSTGYYQDEYKKFIHIFMLGRTMQANIDINILFKLKGQTHNQIVANIKKSL